MLLLLFPKGSLDPQREKQAPYLLRQGKTIHKKEAEDETKVTEAENRLRIP